MTFTEFKVRSILWLIRGFGKLPLGFHYFCGDVLSWIMKKIAHYRYDVVLTNLARSFPEKSYAEIKDIANGYYRHFGELFAETIWFGASDYKRLARQRICEITNLEVLNKVYENSPSVMILFSHCGNWELMGGFVSYNFNPQVVFPTTEHSLKVVYKRLHNEVWDQVIYRNRIAPIGIPDIDAEVETYQLLRYCLKHKNEKFIYIINNDQYPYAQSYDLGKFLNQDTKAMLGSVALAHKLGMSVLYMGYKRVERGKYRITFTPISENASESKPEDMLRKYFDLLEAEINETPSNWLWSHKRWK